MHYFTTQHYLVVLKFCLWFFIPVTGSAQTTIFTETFGNTGIGFCDQGTLADGFMTSNGTWTVTDIGVNYSAANVWYISATEPGMVANSCSDPGCHINPVYTDRTLHIGNVANSPNASVICPTGDCGAIYDWGNQQNSVQTNRRVESPSFFMQGQINHVLQFNYLETGDDTLNRDYMIVEMYDGIQWLPAIAQPARTMPCGNGRAIWEKFTVLLPTLPTTSNVKLGFTWTNDDDSLGPNPSVAIDSIVVYDPTISSVQISVSDSVICFNDCIDFFASPAGPLAVYSWTFSGASITNSNLPNPASVCYPIPGLYNATLNVSTPGGTFTDSIWIDVDSCSVSVIEQGDLNQVEVFPNPAVDYLNVSGLENLGPLQISVYDLLGQLIFTRMVTSNHDNRIDITAIRKGMYLISIHDLSNRTFVNFYELINVVDDLH